MPFIKFSFIRPGMLFASQVFNILITFTSFSTFQASLLFNPCIIYRSHKYKALLLKISVLCVFYRCYYLYAFASSIYPHLLSSIAPMLKDLKYFMPVFKLFFFSAFFIPGTQCPSLLANIHRH